MTRFTRSPSTPGSSPLRDAIVAPQLSPLTTRLVSELDEVAIRRMWANIDTRPQATKRKKLQISGLGHWMVPAFSAALFVLAFFVTARLWDNRAPLAIAGGSTSQELAQGIHVEAGRRQITFADGSQIDLSTSSSLRVLSNSGGSFVTKLDRGNAVFHVTPGGPRRWIVEAGDVTVEVVGTVFSVDRDALGVSVSVERGIVLVRGQVPGGEVRLTRGQRVTTRSTGLRLSAEIDLPSKKAAPVRKHREQPIDRSISLNDLSDEELTNDGISSSDTRAAAEVLSPAGDQALKPNVQGTPTDPSQLSLDDLLSHADEARRNGDSQKAASYFYLASLRAGPADARRGIAALSFARVSADQVAIVRTLIRGLGTMPPSLREPALARLVRAAQKAGNAPLATKYAQVYLEEFPLGPRADLIKSWAALP